MVVNKKGIKKAGCSLLSYSILHISFFKFLRLFPPVQYQKTSSCPAKKIVGIRSHHLSSPLQPGPVARAYWLLRVNPYRFKFHIRRNIWFRNSMISSLLSYNHLQENIVSFWLSPFTIPGNAASKSFDHLSGTNCKLNGSSSEESNCSPYQFSGIMNFYIASFYLCHLLFLICAALDAAVWLKYLSLW